MASAKKKCRVCGKEYEACRSANRTDGIFRWQEVACSVECGAIYLQQIAESRSPSCSRSLDGAVEPVLDTDELIVNTSYWPIKHSTFVDSEPR